MSPFRFPLPAARLAVLVPLCVLAALSGAQIRRGPIATPIRRPGPIAAPIRNPVRRPGPVGVRPGPVRRPTPVSGRPGPIHAPINRPVRGPGRPSGGGTAQPIGRPTGKILINGKPAVGYGTVPNGGGTVTGGGAVVVGRAPYQRGGVWIVPGIPVLDGGGFGVPLVDDSDAVVVGSGGGSALPRGTMGYWSRPTVGVIEGEHLKWVVTGGQTNIWKDKMLSGGGALRWHGAPVGATATTTLDVPEAGRYEVIANLNHSRGCGRFRVTVDNGAPTEMDLYQNADPNIQAASLGVFNLPAGETTVRFEALDANRRSKAGNRALHVDYFLLRSVPVSDVSLPIEAENLTWSVTDGNADMQTTFTSLSGGGEFFWRKANVGSTATTTFDVPVQGRYEVLANLSHWDNGGRFRIRVGNSVPKEIDTYHEAPGWWRVSLGSYVLPAGPVGVRIEVLQANPSSKAGWNAIGIDFFTLHH